jgi:hypothetical protein
MMIHLPLALFGFVVEARVVRRSGGQKNRDFVDVF